MTSLPTAHATPEPATRFEVCWPHERRADIRVTAVATATALIVFLVVLWWQTPGWHDSLIILALLIGINFLILAGFGYHWQRRLARQRLVVDLDAQTLTFEGFAFHRDGRGHRPPGTVVMPMTAVTTAALQTPIFGSGDRLTITVPPGDVSVPDGFTNFQELVAVLSGLTGEPLEPDPWRRTAQWVIVGATIATGLAALVKLIW